MSQMPCRSEEKNWFLQLDRFSNHVRMWKVNMSQSIMECSNVESEHVTVNNVIVDRLVDGIEDVIINYRIID